MDGDHVRVGKKEGLTVVVGKADGMSVKREGAAEEVGDAEGDSVSSGTSVSIMVGVVVPLTNNGSSVSPVSPCRNRAHSRYKSRSSSSSDVSGRNVDSGNSVSGLVVDEITSSSFSMWVVVSCEVSTAVLSSYDDACTAIELACNVDSTNRKDIT